MRCRDGWLLEKMNVFNDKKIVLQERRIRNHRSLEDTCMQTSLQDLTAGVL
jgi:hypothetical protein